jgi:uncharacterized protein YunC (DUF1805 family)
MEQIIKLTNATAKGYCVNAGPFNIIFCTTGKGMVACGAFSVEALSKLDYPAVRVKSPVKTVEDVLNAPAAQVNTQGVSLGIVEGMTGRECLEKML